MGEKVGDRAGGADADDRGHDDGDDPAPEAPFGCGGVHVSFSCKGWLNVVIGIADQSVDRRLPVQRRTPVSSAAEQAVGADPPLGRQRVNLPAMRVEPAELRCGQRCGRDLDARRRRSVRHNTDPTFQLVTFPAVADPSHDGVQACASACASASRSARLSPQGDGMAVASTPWRSASSDLLPV